MRMKAMTIGVLVGALALGACAKPGERVLFDGKYYPARVKKDGDQRENFVVTVQRVEQGLNGAREAGRYEGITYCVENYGSSDITWINGPEDEAAALTDSGNLVLRGSCVKW